MTACGPVLNLEFALYLFSPLLVPIAFAAVAAGVEIVINAVTRT